MIKALSFAMASCLFVVSLVFTSDANQPGKKQPPESNLILDASTALLNGVVQRSIDQSGPVQEVIQDTPVHGRGRTVGTVRAEFIPDQSQAALDVVFEGCNWSQTVGERPHTQIFTFTTTPFAVRQRVVMDGKGIRMFAGPMQAQAATQLLDISSRTWPEGITVRLAQKGFQQSQAAGEAETAHKTANKLAKGMADDLAPTLASVSRTIGDGLKQIDKAGIKREAFALNTTATYLQGRLRFATPGRADPNTAPALPPKSDLAIRLHEALANEAAQVQLGGRAFGLEEVGAIYFEVTRGLVRGASKDGKPGPDLNDLGKLLAAAAGKPVTITFTKKDPLTVAFADQSFTVEIRLASLKQEKKIYEGVRLRVTYAFDNTKRGVEAVRKGPVQILPVDKSEWDPKAEPLPPQDRVLQETLFAQLLQDRLILDPLPLPETITRLPLAPPRGYAHKGWFGLVYSLREAK